MYHIFSKEIDITPENERNGGGSGTIVIDDDEFDVVIMETRNSFGVWKSLRVEMKKLHIRLIVGQNEYEEMKSILREKKEGERYERYAEIPWNALFNRWMWGWIESNPSNFSTILKFSFDAGRNTGIEEKNEEIRSWVRSGIEKIGWK